MWGFLPEEEDVLKLFLYKLGFQLSIGQSVNRMFFPGPISVNLPSTEWGKTRWLAWPVRSDRTKPIGPNSEDDVGFALLSAVWKQMSWCRVFSRARDAPLLILGISTLDSFWCYILRPQTKHWNLWSNVVCYSGYRPKTTCAATDCPPLFEDSQLFASATTERFSTHDVSWEIVLPLPPRAGLPLDFVQGSDMNLWYEMHWEMIWIFATL